MAAAAIGAEKPTISEIQPEIKAGSGPKACDRDRRILHRPGAASPPSSP